jgi:quinoprotein glucose dehydrogenase
MEMDRRSTGLALLLLATGAFGADADWPAYGGDAAKTRHSPLAQINRGNVKLLARAWSHDTHEKGDTHTQPIVVGRVLYGYTPSHKALALDAATGKLLWEFDSGIKGTGANRGLMYWANGAERRVFAAVDNFVYALDPDTGKPVPGFGKLGRIDLRADLGRDPQTQSVRLTSPGVIYRDLMIVGGRVGESLPASPGHVRAYDVRTGALRWSFHTIPQPGEPGYETWPKDAWNYIGGANSWPGMTLDAKRGLVFVPTGSAAADFYGANRAGDNLYANCLLALEAATGKLRWHFQFVKHDVLDRDLPTAPTLVTLRVKGRRIDALAQTTKQGFVFVLDRDTGKPVFPIEEVPAPASDVPGEISYPTYLRPAKPAPYARQRLTPDDLTTRTPEANAWARAQFAQLRSDGPFKPIGIGVDTTIYPGFDGGAEWGGPAYDPETGLLYVNANEMGWVLKIVPREETSLFGAYCAECHGPRTTPLAPTLTGVAQRLTRAQIVNAIRSGTGRMPAFATSLGDSGVAELAEYLVSGKPTRRTPRDIPTFLKYRNASFDIFLDHEGYPAIKPPWGSLTAIDLNTGRTHWSIPFGEYPKLAAQGMTNTGSDNYGGAIVTRNGLLIIAATTYDNKIRAFDKASGKLLWEARLPAASNTTPATYMVNGRQYIVVACGGGKNGAPSGGSYVAFALP